MVGAEIVVISGIVTEGAVGIDGISSDCAKIKPVPAVKIIAADKTFI
jgi:hypothetical protein